MFEKLPPELQYNVFEFCSLGTLINFKLLHYHIDYALFEKASNECDNSTLDKYQLMALLKFGYTDIYKKLIDDEYYYKLAFEYATTTTFRKIIENTKLDEIPKSYMITTKRHARNMITLIRKYDIMCFNYTINPKLKKCLKKKIYIDDFKIGIYELLSNWLIYRHTTDYLSFNLFRITLEVLNSYGNVRIYKKLVEQLVTISKYQELSLQERGWNCVLYLDLYYGESFII